MIEKKIARGIIPTARALYYQFISYFITLFFTILRGKQLEFDD
jgi:hypothetical protein